MTEAAAAPLEVPADLQGIADTLNAWCATFAALRPGGVTFRADTAEVIRDGHHEVGVRLWTILSTGPVVVTIPPDLADELATLLRARAREARSGLVVAGSVPA